MDYRRFGSTGLDVSGLGLGAGPLGLGSLTESDAERLLHGAVDAGVTLIDTARSYGESEVRIGRHLGGRRAGVILSTKLGYGIEGVPDWTGECAARGVDAALVRLRTDWIDIVHLHSCPLEILGREEIVSSLVAAVAAGKVRVIGYSGDNAEAAYAATSGRFGSLQTSLSLVDRASEATIAVARDRRLGVIAKRPLGNAPWRFDELPDAPDLAEYWRRWQSLGDSIAQLVATSGAAAAELAIRFAAHQPGVSTAILGTASLDHLLAGVRAVERGPLPADTVASLSAAYRTLGERWPGVI
jgi:aryl-alcohol dehydrogenase-like predicted oxidoreductase